MIKIKDLLLLFNNHLFEKSEMKEEMLLLMITEIQETLRDYEQQFYANKLDNLKN